MLLLPLVVVRLLIRACSKRSVVVAVAVVLPGGATAPGRDAKLAREREAKTHTSKHTNELLMTLARRRMFGFVPL